MNKKISISENLKALNKSDFKKWFEKRAESSPIFKDEKWEDHYNNMHPPKKEEKKDK